MIQELKACSTYENFVTEQCQLNPCLQNLCDFLADDRSKHTTGRVACLDFLATDGPPQHHSLDLDGLARVLDERQTTLNDNLLGRVVILEDLSKDVVEIIGSSVKVDPFFFASHLHISRGERNIKKAWGNALPSRSRDQQYLTISYVRPIVFGRCATPAKLRVDANVRRKVGPHKMNDCTVAYMGSNISSLMISEEGHIWICLVLVDPPLKNSFLSDDWRSERAGMPIILRPQLFQGGYEDFLTTRSPSSSSSCGDTANRIMGPKRISMLDDLVNYWKRAQPPDFDAACPTLLTLSYYPLQIAVAEWMTYVNFMHYNVEHYENSIEAAPVSLDELTKLEADLRWIQGWRRRYLCADKKVLSTVNFIRSHMSSAPKPDAWASLVRDYEYISSEIKTYSHRLEGLVPALTSLVHVGESRRSFEETKNLSRLTYLALVFMPLTFVSSLFSMTSDVAPAGRRFWVYFVVAVPLVAVVFLVARTPKTRLSYIGGLLRVYPIAPRVQEVQAMARPGGSLVSRDPV